MKLPNSQMISDPDLELDTRVTEHINEIFQNKLDLIKRKLAYDLERSDVQMKKLLKYLTDPVDLHPLTVRGINNPNLYVMTVRQRTMPKLFFDTINMVEEQLAIEAQKGRSIDFSDILFNLKTLSKKIFVM